ncbi:MAG: peptide chain release factor N(5)-glutamine methyltransferase [Candidatus Limiplasma sp.]|nr:peptide chain release factor N(5)-glutamine methyltransferase [Candidatus Limiplasma sp.]
MTIRQALAQAVGALQAAGIPDPRTDAALLLADVTGIPPMELLLHGQQALTSPQERRISPLLLSRASRKPLQYLLGTQHFYGLSLAVDERALIPRPETEILCELALGLLRAVESPKVLDVCTGSGAIALAVKAQCPAASVTATDISEDALALARENARRHEASIRFLPGDLFAPVEGETFDCILSNPPYIESAACLSLQPEVRFEPLLALDGGADGLDFYRRIAREAAAHLNPQGVLCLEIGDTQGEAVRALLEAQGRYRQISIHRDLNGSQRVVTAHAASFPT